MLANRFVVVPFFKIFLPLETLVFSWRAMRRGTQIIVESYLKYQNLKVIEDVTFLKNGELANKAYLHKSRASNYQQ